MKVKAVISFSGALSMAKGEETEYSNEAVLRDLLAAGYIEEAETPKRSVKKNEGKRDSEK